LVKLSGKVLHSKRLWISIAIAIPFGLSLYFKELSNLQLIYALFILTTLPFVAATSYSPEFAANFIKLHERFHKKKGIYIKMPSDLRFSIWKSAGRTVVYVFAMIYTILDWSGISETVFGSPGKLVFLVALVLMTLIIASIFEVSIFLLRRYGLIFENKNDGTRINLGEDLHRKLDYIASPIALVSFTHTVLTKSFNLQFVVIMLLTFVAISFYSTTISFLMLRRKNIPDQMIAKLDRLINKKNKTQ
jgi:hypothetical protein